MDTSNECAGQVQILSWFDDYFAEKCPFKFEKKKEMTEGQNDKQGNTICPSHFIMPRKGGILKLHRLYVRLSVRPHYR
jgi:hypothetical protein